MYVVGKKLFEHGKVLDFVVAQGDWLLLEGVEEGSLGGGHLTEF
jgi:hypothetical protein